MDHLDQNIVEQKQKQVVIISLESFYRTLTEEEQERANGGTFNFDHPSNYAFSLISIKMFFLL